MSSMQKAWRLSLSSLQQDKRWASGKSATLLRYIRKWGHKVMYCPQIGETDRWTLVHNVQWNGMATFKDSLAGFYKIKHTLTIWSNDTTLWYLPKWAENLGPQKTLHTRLQQKLPKVGINQDTKIVTTKCGTFMQWNIQWLKRNDLSNHHVTCRNLGIHC